MASKNPIKGYIKCPTVGCACAASVHAVGEFKAQTRGEQPKNPRRLGQLYLICPTCKTNQSSGKPFQDWLTDNMKPTEAEALENSHVVKPHIAPLSKPTQTAPVLTPDAKTDAIKETETPTQTEPNQTDSNSLIGWGAALLVVCFALFMMTNNKKELNHE